MISGSNLAWFDDTSYNVPLPLKKSFRRGRLVLRLLHNVTCPYFHVFGCVTRLEETGNMNCQYRGSLQVATKCRQIMLINPSCFLGRRPQTDTFRQNSYSIWYILQSLRKRLSHKKKTVWSELRQIMIINPSCFLGRRPQTDTFRQNS